MPSIDKAAIIAAAEAEKQRQEQLRARRLDPVFPYKVKRVDLAFLGVRMGRS